MHFFLFPKHSITHHTGTTIQPDFAIAFKMHKQAMQMYFQSVEFKKHVSDFSPCVCDNGASGVCGTAGKVKH